MARQIIGVGTGPDTHTGEPLRTAWVKTNENFAELYSTTANLANLSANTGNIVFSDQTISGQLANTNITIEPLGTGQVNIVGNLTTSQLRFMGNTISTQFDGDLILESSAGNIKLNDPIKFSDGTVQYSAAVGNAGTVNTLTITNATATTLNSTTGVFTGNVTAGNVQATSFRFANGNSILANISTVGYTGVYNDLTGKPTIPTNTSQLVNDTGFVTSGSLSTTLTWSNVSGKPTFANVATTGSYTDLINTPNTLANLSVDDYNIYNTNGQGVIISNFSFMAEDETAYVQIPAGNSNSDLNVVQEQGNVRLRANNAVWNFDTTGVLTIPGEIQGQQSTIGGYANIRGGFGTAGPGGDVLIAGGASGNGVSEFGNVVVAAGSGSWTFDNAGNLNLPANGEINFAGGRGIVQSPMDDFEILVQDSDDDGWALYNTVDDGAGNVLGRTRLQRDQFDINIQGQQWQFDDTGRLNLPGNIVGAYGGNTSFWATDTGTGGMVEMKTISYIGDTLLANVTVRHPNVTISTQNSSYTWTFDGDGNLTIPGNFRVDSMASPAPIMSGFSSASFIDSLRVDQLRLVDNAITTVDGSSNIILNAQYGSATDSFVQIPTFQDGGEQLVIKNAYNSSLGIRLQTETGNFTFSGTSLTFPDSTTQTTAYTGSTYSDSDVTTLLASLGSNAISSTGNITGGNLIVTNATMTGNLIVNTSIGSQGATDLWLLPATNTTRSYGNINPFFANTYSLGGSSTRWANVYANVANVVTLNTVGNITGGNISASGTIYSTSNGDGTNFQVGDDTWLGDINVADTLSIRGQQNAANAYIVFGNASNVALGRAGTGPLTYGGAFSATGNITGGNISSSGTLTATGKIGYVSGSTVTQLTNRSSGVTINALAGTIVTTSDTIAAGDADYFYVVNNQVEPTTDIVIAQITSYNPGTYTICAQPSAVPSNGFYLTISNYTASGSSTEAITIRFMVIKSPNS